MVAGGVTVFGLSMHPEINTHNKIRANIFGFAVIPPLFSLMRDIAKKLLAIEKVGIIGTSQWSPTS
jgi:hypothetical protein